MKTTIILSALFFYAGCQNQPKETPPPTPARPAPTQGAASSVGTATLKGSISFNGVPPKEPVNPAKTFAECAAWNPEDRHLAYRVKDGKFSNVFVYLKEGVPSQNYPVPTEPVVLDQERCAYVPRILGIRAGQPLDIKNSDPILHNVHALAQVNPPFNVGMPMQGMKITRTFSKPEVMTKFKCDVHGWMTAYVGVMEHPFFDVSKEGSYTISNVAAGTYTVEAWHEKAGAKSEKITIADGETKELNFTY